MIIVIVSFFDRSHISLSFFHFVCGVGLNCCLLLHYCTFDSLFATKRESLVIETHVTWYMLYICIKTNTFDKSRGLRYPFFDLKSQLETYTFFTIVYPNENIKRAFKSI